MKKIIITGVSGQVGSYMAEFCLNLGHKVYGVTRSTHQNNILGILSNPNFKLVVADLTDDDSIIKLTADVLPDYFINLAAQSSVGGSWKIPVDTLNVDVLGVVRCLEAIRKISPRCRFYNAGSSEQFGHIEYSPQDEKHNFNPNNPYGIAKCSAHHIVKMYRDSYNIYAVQGISFNHESERRSVDFVTRKITAGVARILSSLSRCEVVKPIELGNLDVRRDWSHVEDFVDGVWRMLNQEKYNERLSDVDDINLPKNIKDYILSSGESHSIREFVELSFKYAGFTGCWDFVNGISPENETFIVSVPESNCLLEAVTVNQHFLRPMDSNSPIGNNFLIRKELGWNPTIEFKRLVERMVKNDLISVIN